MRITILNQFYPPDLAPTAHLAASLAAHRAAKGDEVTVITGSGSYVDGASSGSASETVGQGNATSTGSGARVPAAEVIPTYRDEALSALDRGRVPPSARDLVQRYFDSISGG